MKGLLFLTFIQDDLLSGVFSSKRIDEERPAGVEENVTVDTPERIRLLSSRHNPFAISTHIFFALPRASHMSLA
jgi:hypothetical protein